MPDKIQVKRYFIRHILSHSQIHKPHLIAAGIVAIVHRFLSPFDIPELKWQQRNFSGSRKLNF